MESSKLAVSPCREVAVKTEGFQAGDLVTVMDRAISNSELRIVLPEMSNPAEEHSWHEISVDSSMSDLEGSVDYHSFPPTQDHTPLNTLPETSTPETAQLLPELGDSGIGGSGPQSLASHLHLQRLKKVSVVSASSFSTVVSPNSLQGQNRFSALTPPGGDRNPVYKTGSLSERSLRLCDFSKALEGFVPLSLRGLPLHTSGSVDFSHVGGLKAVKEMLTETLQWPIKVSKWVGLGSGCKVCMCI